MRSPRARQLPFPFAGTSAVSDHGFASALYQTSPHFRYSPREKEVAFSAHFFSPPPSTRAVSSPMRARMAR